MEETIKKRKLDIILLVDTSRSMHGAKIEQVNNAIEEIKTYLMDFQNDNINVNFHLTILTFGTEAKILNNLKSVDVKNFKCDKIKCFGQTNLNLAYNELNTLLLKESKGGIMSDFGGLAPIILLLSDGHPGKPYKANLEQLKNRGWWKYAIRYGIAIGLNDRKTKKVIKDFTGDNGECISSFNVLSLGEIIKVVVVTSSKVKSRSTNVSSSAFSRLDGLSMTKDSMYGGKPFNPIEDYKQQINNELSQLDDVEW